MRVTRFAEPYILHIIDHTGSGGAQVVVHYILKALNHQFTFAVAVLGEAGRFSNVYAALDVPVVALGDRRGRWGLLPFLGLYRMMRREPFDLVHTHLLKANTLGIIVARLSGCSTILHDHSSTLPHTLAQIPHFSNRLVRQLYVRLYQLALGQCDQVLVPTPADAQSYQANYALDPSKVSVVPNAIDLERFGTPVDGHDGQNLRQELNLPAQTKLVIMSGRLESCKGWHTFLKVAQRLQQEADLSCGFLVVGSGSQDQDLRGYAVALGLDNVFFLGHREDIPSLLRQADAFLLTSHRESFGIAILEAMAAGCPVVATRCSGPRSILTDGKDGLLAEVGDVQGLANRVLLLLRDSAISHSLVHNAHITVSQNYSLKIVAAKVADVYMRVLEQRR